MRVVVTAGREAARTTFVAGDEASLLRGIDAPAFRAIATALVGGHVPLSQLDAAFDAFAADGDGVRRFEAMVQRAQQSLVRSDGEAGSESLPVERVLSLLSIHAAFLRALHRRRASSESSYERFAGAVAGVVDAEGFDDLCLRTARALRDLSGMQVAAVFVPGSEHARFVRAAYDSAEASSADIPSAGGASSSDRPGASLVAPAWLRVDRGLFADVIAGERPMYISGPDPIEALSGTDHPVRTMIAVPLRDSLNRPVGLALVLHDQPRELDVDTIESLRRLGAVVEGVLSTADTTRRNRAALATLPELATIAHREQLAVNEQLDSLAAIVARATDSDAAVVRICDPAGSYLETTAVSSRHGDAVSDIIGTRTLLDGSIDEHESGGAEHELVGFALDGFEVAGWSSAGKRIIEVLGARTIGAYPIGSLYQRTGVLYVARKTARAFDEADRACARIVTSHVQHVIDRHVSELQTDRAIEAARSAIRLLGEALVAGVRTDRTLRFVPRLFHEMFDTKGCRVWRRDRTGELQLVAGAGSFEHAEPSSAVARSLAAPLELVLNTDQRPHVAAVCIDEFHGTRVAIEFVMGTEHSLGQEEQQLAIDVATRVAEALWSAEQAVAHELQLDRVRGLQTIIAAAHEQLSEAHVVATVLDEVPAQYGAAAAAVFIVGAGGRLESRAERDFPQQLTAAISAARNWAPDRGSADERAPIMAMHNLGKDARIAAFHEAIEASGFSEHSGVIIPLTGREQTVGALVMAFDGPLPDGLEGEGTMLPAFGRHIGSALLNAREFERERLARTRIQRVLDVERENSRQVRALHEVSRTFATSLSLDETMRAVVEAMADRLDVDAVWIRTPNERGDQMLLRAFYASHPELSGALERMVAAPDRRDDALTLQVMNTRQPMLIDGGEESDPRWAGSEVLQRLGPFLQRGSTVAVLPVAIPNEVLGTLTMLSIDPGNALTYDKVDVAAGVTSQAALALDNARLYQQQKHFAEVIQESLLPGRLPDMPGIDLGVLYRSATAGGATLIGGDFYDFLELEDGRLAMAVGDVTGKGVGAAADTAMTKYIFRALAREHPSPASFLKYANEVVCEEITPGKFVTLFYAVIDPIRNTLICGNAGHPEPKLLRPPLPGGSGEPEIVSLGMEGLALGILADQDYEQREYKFEPGTSLVVYTDGVVEARRDSRLYGQYRLERRLVDEAGSSAPQIAFAVYQDCAAYAEDGLGDDVAIVVAQRLLVDQEPEPTP